MKKTVNNIRKRNQYVTLAAERPTSSPTEIIEQYTEDDTEMYLLANGKRVIKEIFDKMYKINRTTILPKHTKGEIIYTKNNW